MIYDGANVYVRVADRWMAREAARRGRGMGHVQVACTSCHNQLRQTVFFEPPHDSGHRPLTGWVTGPDPQP
jgi:hypothetical protein